MPTGALGYAAADGLGHALLRQLADDVTVETYCYFGRQAILIYAAAVNTRIAQTLTFDLDL